MSCISAVPIWMWYPIAAILWGVFIFILVAAWKYSA